jgi:integrase
VRRYPLLRILLCAPIAGKNQLFDPFQLDHLALNMENANRQWVSLAQILDRFTAKNGEGLSNRSITRYATALSAVWKWADKTGRFEGRNPFQGQRRKANIRGWQPFTIDELDRLFGNLPADDAAMRWVPLVGLYSGMRINEICQLRRGDIGQEGDIRFFHVCEGEGQSVKTQAGVRRVPIHSEIRRSQSRRCRPGRSSALRVRAAGH